MSNKNNSPLQPQRVTGSGTQYCWIVADIDHKRSSIRLIFDHLEEDLQRKQLARSEKIGLSTEISRIRESCVLGGPDWRASFGAACSIWVAVSQKLCDIWQDFGCRYYGQTTTAWVCFVDLCIVFTLFYVF